MIRPLFLLLGLLLALSPAAASAHALQPGYVDLQALDDRTWRIFFRKPDVQGRPMAIEADLSAHCTPASGPAPRFDGEGWAAQWIVTCPDGLTGLTIMIAGLDRTSTEVLLRYESKPGEGESARLVPTAPSFTIPAEPGRLDVLASYGRLGFDHILGGLDHLLFVLALLLLVDRPGRLVAAITAFTLAHSLTLGAAALDWLIVPGPPVEALIALSIVVIAADVVRKARGSTSLTIRHPATIAFLFGLIHGLGFGRALQDIGLPQDEILLALLSFNLGVEAGQLTFIAAILMARALLQRALPVLSDWHRRVSITSAYGIGGLSAFWLAERVAAF